MGHNDIIFDNTISMIKELIQYHKNKKKYYLCRDKETVNLLANLYRNLGLMDLYKPTQEQLNHFHSVNWKECTINMIRGIYDEES